MTETDQDQPEAIPMTSDGIPLVVNGRKLTEVEVQALREAKARRDRIDARADVPKEKGGADRDTEPTRYLDWELKGRAVDFS
ncbi:DUF1674 domain-containing protein [Parvularcula maris]|uniref:DUF1674 domain-containing protein n=1 Tax=Parvularcula maris TaxID=2965077 RepID=A0A9X2L677_9PROT|nr:DUF1674 domain-containing protein [Parvularcula maris]MCQ8183829.1 DUF1674 domain-containing protein [Parvularcula maris]